MMPDGDEIYFSVSTFGYNLIFCTKQVDGKWTEPKPVEFITDFQYLYYEPHITHINWFTPFPISFAKYNI